MTTFQAAHTKEQGITFVAVSVRDSLLNDRRDADEMIRQMSRHFGCPAVLVSASLRLYGHQRDIVNFVANNLRRLPWRDWRAA